MTDKEPEYQDESAPDGSEVPADLMPRFLARLIDGAILWLVFMVIVIPIVFSLVFSGASGFGFGFGIGFSGILIGVIWAAVIVGYFAFLESSRGQTVGKMIMKLKTEGPDGQNPTFEMAAKRNLFNALVIIPVLGNLLMLGAVIYIAYTINESPTKTGWHDVFAGGTKVVKLS